MGWLQGHEVQTLSPENGASSDGMHGVVAPARFPVTSTPLIGSSAVPQELRSTSEPRPTYGSPGWTASK